MRVGIVAGTRPEGIKVAPLVLALRAAGHEAVLAATGQHREMLTQVLAAFDLRPDADLGLQNHGLTLAELTAETMRRADGLLAAERFDALVVQGDTTAAFVGALAAFYREVPVVHLEAGLRTWDLAQPWPEEANRQLVSRIAALHLAPSEGAAANLRAERVGGTVVQTGNTVIDALLHVRGRCLPWETPSLTELDHDGALAGDLVLVTLHRRESWGDGLARVAAALRRLALERPGLRVVFPVHRNPVVRAAVGPLLEGLANVTVLEPVPYPDLVKLLDRCRLVLTDSGGLQEEAPALGKPVLVCRDTTERPEAVQAGVARLVGTDTERIAAAVAHLLDHTEAYAAMAGGHNPYGDGDAAPRAVAAIEALA